jgi:hypothetical protein
MVKPRAQHKGKQHASVVPSDEEEEGPASVKGVIAFFIAFGIILAVIVGIVAWNSYHNKALQAENSYNGFDFAQAQGGLWITRIEARGQPYDIPFYFHPRDTEDVIVDPKATAPIYANPAEVVISVDPNAPSKVVIGAVEISRLLGSKYHIFNLYTHSALSAPPPTAMDIPIIDCRNATAQRVVIQFIEGKDDVIAVGKNPNCIILQYTDANESVRVADRYAYMLLKIM